MLGLLLDAGALTLIVMLVNENEQVEFIKALLVALAISLVTGFASAGMVSMGLAVLLLGMVPLAAIAGLVIWLTMGMTMQRSMIAGALFLVYKIAISVAFYMVLG